MAIASPLWSVPGFPRQNPYVERLIGEYLRWTGYLKLTITELVEIETFLQRNISGFIIPAPTTASGFPFRIKIIYN